MLFTDIPLFPGRRLSWGTCLKCGLKREMVWQNDPWQPLVAALGAALFHLEMFLELECLYLALCFPVRRLVLCNESQQRTGKPQERFSIRWCGKGRSLLAVAANIQDAVHQARRGNALQEYSAECQRTCAQKYMAFQTQLLEEQAVSNVSALPWRSTHTCC